jgi:CBS domain-containing protein
MKASNIMTLGAATVRQDGSLLKAVESMVHHRISALPVVDDKERICGILTEGDVVRATNFFASKFVDMPETERKKLLGANTVGKFMTVGAITLDPDESVDDALVLMKQHALKHLPVVEDGKVLGVLSRADILTALVA